MDIYFYKREEYPRPINRSGDFSDTPYTLQLPNTGYLEDIHKYFPLYDAEDTAYALDVIPSYPKLVDGVVIESSLEEYKLKGLLPLESYEEIVDGAIVFMQLYQADLDVKELDTLKESKLTEMSNVKKEVIDTYQVTFTKDGIDYKQRITGTDINAITSTITTLNEAAALGIAEELLIANWSFENNMTAVLNKADIVQLGILAQTTVNNIFAIKATIIKEISELTTKEEVLAYDVRSKYANFL